MKLIILYDFKCIKCEEHNILSYVLKWKLQEK